MFIIRKGTWCDFIMKYFGRLEITTKIGCKCNCLYCPQDLLIKNYYNRNLNPIPDKAMTIETFKICISKVPKDTRIDFSGMAEPWLNADCTDMVLYTHKMGFPIAVYSTLIGMSRNDFDLIKDIPFEEFVVHIPDEKGNARIDITNDYIDLLEQVIDYRQANTKKLVTGISCHSEIHPNIKEFIPENSKLINEICDRAGNLENSNAKQKTGKGEIVCINCGADINHNVLLPDGTVLLCCMDYGMKHILGNLLFQSYEEILNSKEAMFIKKGFKNESVNILCRKCTNSRDINELYDDYIFYKNWNKKISQQYDQRMKELKDYKKWVQNLEIQIEQIKKDYLKSVNDRKEKAKEAEQLNDQYQQRLKELEDYKDWVHNLEVQIAQLKMTF